MLLVAFVFATPAMAAEPGEAANGHSTLDRIENEAGQFNPESVGKRMESKAQELMELAKSGSSLYGSAALVVFLGLLVGGLVFRRLIRLAFYFLGVAVVGYLILNFWPEIRGAIMAFIEWLFKEGGSLDATDTPGV